MGIDNITWEELEPFLSKDCKQSKGSLPSHRGKFRQLQLWFQEKDFTRSNFTLFLEDREKINGDKNPTLNNCIKFVKHLAKYVSNKYQINELYDQFKDYTYFEDDPVQPTNYLTHAQIARLAETRIKYFRYKNKKYKNKALIYFLGHVGSRIDETLKLEWRDIIYDDIPMIHFRKEITKTKKERFCAIPKWLLKMISKLPRDNEKIFSVDLWRFREDLVLRGELCKIPFRVTPHTFRDSSINNKLTAGMPIQEVAEYHGHVNIETTFRYYTRIQAKKLAQSLRKYDPAFKDDQTYLGNVDAVKTHAENWINPRVCDYSYSTTVMENKKKRTIIELIER